MNFYKALAGLFLFGLIQAAFFFFIPINAGKDVTIAYKPEDERPNNKYVDAFKMFKESYVPLRNYYVNQKKLFSF